MSPTKIRRFIRYTLAVLFGFVLGNILAFPLSFIIDLIVGRSVTGAPWSLTAPNFIYNSLMGLFTGFIAVKIAGNRWVAIPVLAQLFPLIVLTVLEQALNRAPASLGYIHPSFWIYTGLPAAILGGYLSHSAHLRALKATLVFIMVILLFTLSFGGLALHVFTTILAYHLSGLAASIFTFILPVISELYWWVASSHASHAFVTGYSRWCLLYGVAIILLLLAFLAWISINSKEEKLSGTANRMSNAEP